MYSRIESVKHIHEIEHPAVRAILEWAGDTEGFEIHHDGDMPARSGLGSSSSFTVGLVQALDALRGRLSSKETLAKNAIHIEQDLIKESVGSQDQVSAAFGGFNRIEFRRDHSFAVRPIVLAPDRSDELQRHLMLFFTGLSRYSSDIAKSKIENLKKREADLFRMGEMVDEAIEILRNPTIPIDDFGRLLHEGWQHKRSLSDKVSTPEIDGIYEVAMSAGAIGGKLLGAGGGGFFLIFARPDRQAAIRERLKHLVHVPFAFEHFGSEIVYQPPSILRQQQ